MKDKKLQERMVLDQFRKAFPAFPKGKVVQGESPDFILRINRHRAIGIELTTLMWEAHRGSNTEKVLRDSLFASLDDAIQKKEKKLPVYQKKWLDAYWLLIIIPPLPFSPLFPIPTLINHYTCRSSFQKVFLFDQFAQQVYSL